MKTLREIQLTKEIQERVIMNDGDLRRSFQDVLDHLYKEHELYVDKDNTTLAVDTWEDILELNRMIKKYNQL